MEASVLSEDAIYDDADNINIEDIKKKALS